MGVQIGGRLYNYYLIFSVSVALAVLGGAYSLFVLEESLDKLHQPATTATNPFDIRSFVQTKQWFLKGQGHKI